MASLFDSHAVHPIYETASRQEAARGLVACAQSGVRPAHSKTKFVTFVFFCLICARLILVSSLSALPDFVGVGKY